MGLFRRNKNNNKPVIRQIIDLIPSHLLRKVIQQHRSDKGCHKYKTYDQLVALLLELLRRVTAFSNFVEKIRICLSFYLSLDYVINQIKPKAQRAGPLQTDVDTITQPTLF